MKKIALLGFVVLIVVFYLLYQNSDKAKVAVPQSSADNSAQVPTVPPTQAPQASPVQSSGYRDGEYAGDITDAFYGPMQVKAVISGGKITDVVFLQYPNDRPTSRMINGQSNPMLKQEAIAAQSANVDIITGATQSSEAFRQSLKSALEKASA